MSGRVIAIDIKYIKVEMSNMFRHFLKLIPDFFSRRTFALFVIYATIIVASFVGAFLVRFDFELHDISRFFSFETLSVVLAVKLLLLIFSGQFRGLLSFFHTPDLISIFWSQFMAVIVFFGIFLLRPTPEIFFSRGIILIDFTLAFLAFCSLRLFLRRGREIGLKSISTKKNVAIIGAGDIGCTLASELISRRGMGLTPCVFLDDSLDKIGKTIMGVPVESLSNANFSVLKHKYALNSAVVAISNFNAARLGTLNTEMRKVGIDVNIVPSYHDLVAGKAKVSRLREVDIEDVLGREPVSLDSENIDALIKNRVIMVTGAGGSIGSELCRQIAERSPSLLVLVEHCEVQLFQIEQDIISREYGIAIRPVVASIADTERMDYLMKRFRPDIIFHAAAHKHVPLMEAQPSEAIKNNSIGTWKLAEVASRNNVTKFVLISTDKAVNPTNAMGASKRLAELSIQAMQSRPENKTVFVAVRFGNVLGSSGSVIPTFKKQILAGGPVTVTHPEVTRYFMTIPEAVGLVLQCGSQASGGEIFVLNMGNPVKIIDLARQVIRLSGYEPDVDIPIKIIGLRPGEKLYEELQKPSETLVETSHSRIYGFISTPPKYADMVSVIDELNKNVNSLTPNRAKELIAKFVPEYKVQFYD